MPSALNSAAGLVFATDRELRGDVLRPQLLDDRSAHTRRGMIYSTPRNEDPPRSRARPPRRAVPWSDESSAVAVIVFGLGRLVLLADVVHVRSCGVSLLPKPIAEAHLVGHDDAMVTCERTSFQRRSQGLTRSS